MKHPKWLLTLVLILLAINVVFYVVWYAFDIQNIVKHKLEQYASKAMKGNLKIEKLSINERHITINNLSYTDRSSLIRMKVKQLQVRYNLLKIFTSGFSIKKVISQVSVYNPDVSVTYFIKPTPGKKPFKIPDLTPYFDVINVNQGKLNLEIAFSPGITKGDTLVISDKFRDINITAKNKRKTDIEFKATSYKGGSFNINSSLNNGRLTALNVQIGQYKPYKVELTNFSDIGSELSLLANYSKPLKNSKPTYSANAILWNTTAKFREYQAVIPYLQIDGDDKVASFTIRNCHVNNNRMNAVGYLFNILVRPSINCEANIESFNLADITPEIGGDVVGKVHISGLLKNPIAKADLKLEEGNILTEKLHSVNVIADYRDKQLTFSGIDMKWRNQKIDVLGTLDITNPKLTIDLSSNPVSYNEAINLETIAHGVLTFDKGTHIQADIAKLNFYNEQTSLIGFKGQGKLELGPASSPNQFITVSLANDYGIRIEASGNLPQKDYHSVIYFNDVILEDYLKYAGYNGVKARISGTLESELLDKVVKGNTNFDIDLKSPKAVKTGIKSEFSYDTQARNGVLTLQTVDGKSQNVPFQIGIDLNLMHDDLMINDLHLDDVVDAKGILNLSDPYKSSILLSIDSLDVQKYWTMFSPDQHAFPISSLVNGHLDYGYSNPGSVAGILYTEDIITKGLNPFKAAIDIVGTNAELDATATISTSPSNKLIINSKITRNPELNLSALCNITQFQLESLLKDVNVKGEINGTIEGNIDLSNIDGSRNSLTCNLNSQRISYEDFNFDNVNLSARQDQNILYIDTLNVKSMETLDVACKGTLDYSLFRNRFLNGNHKLQVSISGDALRLIKTFIPYFVEAKGIAECQLLVSANEDGLSVDNGRLNMKNGVLRLKDQVEAISDIDLECVINDNQLRVKKLVSQAGNGKLYIRNIIDKGDDNFYIGPLNMGYFLIRTSDTGIQASFPDYLPANTVATAIIRGQHGKEATIKGPFDDMEIQGEIIVSNGSAIYPPKTKNLLQLITLLQKKPLPEQLPLPFTMDLMIRVADNVHYVTYPANLTCTPGSFLRIIYNGNMWTAKEADFSSDKGTIDFYGTTFECQNARLEINTLGNMISLQGRFSRKAPDGTLVTLLVSTNPQKGNDLSSQIEFKLTSDNPQDKTTAQILSRLRYNKNIDELSPEQRQSLLQDEAMQLISTSVSTTYVSQFLSPIENKVRRFLKLDSFSISTGFIQNLFVEFTNSNQNDTNIAANTSLNNDILQFSSSVFLNNLSLSFGKYLGNSVFLDYEMLLQETTDLANKTKLDLYHTASLRFNLPLNLKMVYSFSLRPDQETPIHEVMLQRSFHF